MKSRFCQFLFAAILVSLPLLAAKAENLEQVSERFVGAPYLLGALGEGADGKYDRDPLYRFDAFDCTTFVETSMALALSQDPVSFERQIIAIRYRHGEISFTTRNHFPEGDWVPNNTAAGFMRDITAEVAAPEIIDSVTITVKKQAWYAKLGPQSIQIPDLNEEQRTVLLAELHQEGEAFADTEATTPYLSLATLFRDTETTQRILNRIPSGAIINIVRPNWDIEGIIGTRLAISHQGLMIRKNDVLFMRHASQVAKQVIDSPAEEQLRAYLNIDPNRGIQILELQKGVPAL